MQNAQHFRAFSLGIKVNTQNAGRFVGYVVIVLCQACKAPTERNGPEEQNKFCSPYLLPRRALGEPAEHWPLGLRVQAPRR